MTPSDIPAEQPTQVSAPALRERRGLKGWVGRVWHRLLRTPR